MKEYTFICDHCWIDDGSLNSNEKVPAHIKDLAVTVLAKNLEAAKYKAYAHFDAVLHDIEFDPGGEHKELLISLKPVSIQEI